MALEFTSLEDFAPDKIVQQIEPLRQLYEARQRLNDLIAKLDGNDDLDDLLKEVAENTDSLEQLKKLAAEGAEEGADEGSK